VKDEVLALALHPTGNYFVASFNSDIKFFNFYPTEFKEYHIMRIKSCKELKFSQYGNLLAC